MAKDDPESSLAEDQAYERWANDTNSREAAKFFALEDRDELWEHIYRQGFRAGREQGRQNPAGRVEGYSRIAERFERVERRLDALERWQSKVESRTFVIEPIGPVDPGGLEEG